MAKAKLSLSQPKQLLLLEKELKELNHASKLYSQGKFVDCANVFFHSDDGFKEYVLEEITRSKEKLGIQEATYDQYAINFLAKMIQKDEETFTLYITQQKEQNCAKQKEIKLTSEERTEYNIQKLTEFFENPRDLPLDLGTEADIAPLGDNYCSLCINMECSSSL